MGTRLKTLWVICLLLICVACSGQSGNWETFIGAGSSWLEIPATYYGGTGNFGRFTYIIDEENGGMSAIVGIHYARPLKGRLLLVGGTEIQFLQGTFRFSRVYLSNVADPDRSDNVLITQKLFRIQLPVELRKTVTNGFTFGAGVVPFWNFAKNQPLDEAAERIMPQAEFEDPIQGGLGFKVLALKQVNKKMEISFQWFFDFQWRDYIQYSGGGYELYPEFQSLTLGFHYRFR